MKRNQLGAATLKAVRVALSTMALLQLTAGATVRERLGSIVVGADRSPIKHLIVIIGENRSFDHIFATYVPPSGEQVWNLLSEGIIQSDGSRARIPQGRTARGHRFVDRRLFAQPPQRLRSRTECCRRRWSADRRIPTSPGQPDARAAVPRTACPSDYYQYLVSGGTG